MTEADPSPTFNVVAFSGSLRSGSSNTGLVRAAQRLAPPALRIMIVDWIDQLPWMNPDLEADLPPVVQRWQAAVAETDALLIGLPEYNANPPALAKNAIDWASRPLGSRPLQGKAIAMMSSAGRSGGTNSQQALTPILTRLGNVVVEDAPVQLVNVAEQIHRDGGIADPTLEAVIVAKLDALVSALIAMRTPSD